MLKHIHHPQRERVILVTGANGEVGTELIRQLSPMNASLPIVTLDIHDLTHPVHSQVTEVITGSILDTDLLHSLTERYEIETVFHLAALLSTHSELYPETAHQVNVQGTINLLKMTVDQIRSSDSPVRFIYPSSIAVYGLPDLATKETTSAVRETQYLQPITMYGCNKLYGEHLGRYYAEHYRQLSAERPASLDFRCVRFPGLISAHTIPTGGTSDFAPEMLHAAAQSKAYSAYVRENTRIPFMVMPDAIKALLLLSQVSHQTLKQHVYNVSSFTLSAIEVAERVKISFPETRITFKPDESRHRILDTWPADMDDTPARADWGWFPDFDLDRAFSEYLIPSLIKSTGAQPGE